MIIVMQPGATKKQLDHLVARIKSLKLRPWISKGIERTIVGVIGDESVIRTQPIEAFPGVEKVLSILKPYKLVSRDFKKEPSVVDIGGVKVGGNRITVMAGPCSVENKKLLIDIAKNVKKAGATILRGGAFKPRTSPYDFQGLGEEGLRILQSVGKEVGIATVTEVMDTRDVELISGYAEAL